MCVLATAPLPAGGGEPSSTQPAAPASPTSPVGKWKTVDDDTGRVESIVEITEKDGKLSGRIEKLMIIPGDDPDPKCDKCEGEKKDKPITGMTIIWGLTRDGDEWNGGTVLDPDKGKLYRCYIKLLDAGRRLKIRGYIGISLLGRTQYWLRAE